LGVAALGLSVLASSSVVAASTNKKFAIVIGSNHPGRSGLPALLYADDDAVRSFEILRAQGVEALLLTTFDEETKTSYPWAVPLARAPDRATIVEAVERILDDVARAKQAGESVDFFFVYSGHGGFTDAGEGALYLSDGVFSRQDLYERVLSRSTADFNHLVVDACDAYFFVSSRGDRDGVDRRLDARARKYLDDRTLDRFPNTGAILATSRAAQAHEWSEYQGGVFSHQVRSALLGAGDVDGDGAVTYAEVGAFVTAANARLVHPKARLDVFVHAPARDVARPIASWKGNAAPILTLERSARGHLWVEDARGTRLLESNQSAEQPVRLALPRRERYYLTLGDAEYAFTAAPGNEVMLQRLSRSTARVRARGSIADALREGLFAEPYGTTYFAGHQTRLAAEAEAAMAAAVADDSAARSARIRRMVGYGFLGASVLAGATGVVFRSLSNDAYADYNTALPEDKDHLREKTRSLDRNTTASFIVAGGAAAVGIGLLLHEWLDRDPGFAVLPGPTSVSLAMRF
jgi:hypothetical protein